MSSVDTRDTTSLKYITDDKGNIVIPQKVQDYMKAILDLNIWFVEGEGAKRAGKDVFGLAAYAGLLDAHPDKFHLALATSSSQAILLILDANGFGLKYHFENGELAKGLDESVKDKLTFKFTDSVGRDKIIVFAGGMNQDSYKSFRGPSFGTVYMNEANLLHINTLNEAKDRTMASSIRKIIATQNPDNPKASFYVDFEASWNKESRAKETDADYLEKVAKYYRPNPNGVWNGSDFQYFHFTQKDNPMFSEEDLLRNEKSFTNEVEKKRNFYGIRIASEGLIYDMLTEENLYGDETDEVQLTYDMKQKFERYIACDYGTANPHVYLSTYYDRETHTLYFDDEDVWDSREEGCFQKTDVQHVETLKSFISKDGFGKYKYLIVDPSAASFINACKQGLIRVKKADNSTGLVKPKSDQQKVDNKSNPKGIKLVQDGIVLKKIMINRRCKVTLSEFEAYVWDAKAKERGIDLPLKTNDHTMDAIRYIVNTVIKNIRKWVRREYEDDN